MTDGVAMVPRADYRRQWRAYSELEGENKALKRECRRLEAELAIGAYLYRGLEKDLEGGRLIMMQREGDMMTYEEKTLRKIIERALGARELDTALRATEALINLSVIIGQALGDVEAPDNDTEEEKHGDV